MEVKENMTLGTTLVTNPKGGFLVRKDFLLILKVFFFSGTITKTFHPFLFFKGMWTTLCL